MDIGKAADEFFGDSVGKVFLRSIAGKILEGKYRQRIDSQSARVGRASMLDHVTAGQQGDEDCRANK